jgi:hypothetical protein
MSWGADLAPNLATCHLREGPAERRAFLCSCLTSYIGHRLDTPRCRPAKVQLSGALSDGPTMPIPRSCLGFLASHAVLLGFALLLAA